MKKVIVGMCAAAVITTASAESPFSAELLVGNASQDLEFDDTPKESDTSVAIRLGYHFSNGFALEAAYQDYGDAEARYVDSFGDDIVNTSSASGITFGVKKDFYLSDSIALNGRIGVSFWDLDVTRTDSSFSNNPVIDADTSGNSLYYGVGLVYIVNPKLFISADYTRTTMNSEGVYASTVAYDRDNNITNLTVGIGYNF